MEPTAGFITGFTPNGHVAEETGLELLQFREEIHGLMSLPTENSSFFTALLEVPAMELLPSPASVRDPITAKLLTYSLRNSVNSGLHFQPLGDNVTFPSDRLTVEQAANLPGFTGEKSTDTTSSLSSNLDKVKKELILEPDESKPLISDPTVENSNQRSAKRKNREKKGKGLTKKCKNESSECAEKLPYVYVRARRGQATDSHSLAERSRREKINARMKLLQDLVPGCSKISGTTLVLDEIINHVQSLQRQAEFLSMRLATVNPSIDFNLDTILDAESEYIMDGNFSREPTALMWPSDLIGGNRQEEEEWEFEGLHHPGWERREEGQKFISPGHSSFTYDSSTHSAPLHSNQLKMGL